MSRSEATLDALGVAVAIKVPVLLWGAPGTGKTSVVRQLASSLALPCEVGVDTRCCGCGQLIDVGEELSSFGDTGDIGASRHDRDSRNGYDLFHRRCPGTDIQNKQLATREEFFSNLLRQGLDSAPATGPSLMGRDRRAAANGETMVTGRDPRSRLLQG